MKTREAKKERKTNETNISVELCISGEGRGEISTGVAFFDHMLEQFARHGRFDLKIKAQGDTHIDAHHTVEDVGIVLGEAFKKALDDRRGTKRYASSRVPMDDCLVEADIDLTSRAFLFYSIKPNREFIGDFDTSLPLEFWRAFVNNCGLNLHIAGVRGENAHHLIEASFKAVARALRSASEIDPSGEEKVLSTKGIL